MLDSRAIGHTLNGTGDLVTFYEDIILALFLCSFNILHFCFWLKFNKRWWVHCPKNKADFRENKGGSPLEGKFSSNPWKMKTTFLELLGNFPHKGLPPLYLRKSARFSGQCVHLEHYTYVTLTVAARATVMAFCTISLGDEHPSSEKLMHFWPAT